MQRHGSGKGLRVFFVFLPVYGSQPLPVVFRRYGYNAQPLFGRLRTIDVFERDTVFQVVTHFGGISQ